MNRTKQLREKNLRRARRVRAHIAATADRPRLSVHRSLKHIRGQIIEKGGRVIVAVSDEHLKDKKLKGVARAAATGKLLAERAGEKKVSKVVFDKGRYAYHGRVKAFADAVREGGLEL